MHGPWGKRGHIECGGEWGFRPAKRVGKRAVGIKQWRRLDAFKMLESSRDGLSTTQNLPYAQSTYHMCNVCVKSVILQIIVIVNRVLLCLSVSGK